MPRFAQSFPSAGCVGGTSSAVIPLVLTCALLAIVHGSALTIALRLRPRPLPLALPLAIAILVAYEGVAMPLLSAVHGVTPAGIALAQLPLAAGAFVLVRRDGAVTASRLLRGSSRALRPRWLFAILCALGCLIAMTGLLYPPNTWDSMTYHLSRVGYWLANGSVGVRDTLNPRQALFPPGAEYLLLVPQGIAGSDRLAFLTQWVSWVTVVVSAPALARAFGAPRAASPAAALLAATLPMGVLQAASTQNDLVAAATAVAVVIAALPLAHSRAVRNRDGIALGVAIAAAWLVKPTALVAALPFLLWSAVAGATRGGLGSVAARFVRPALAAAVPLALVVLAETARRHPTGYPVIERHYLYPLVGDWVDRLFHSVRALGHHLPVAGVLAALTPGLATPEGPGVGDGPQPFRMHEDYAGNPIQTLFFLGAMVTLAIRWHALPRRARMPPLAMVASWLVLHALLRENAWFSRLETPLFVLGPTALSVFAGARSRLRRAIAVAFATAAAPLLAVAFVVAASNELRPLSVLPPDPVASYYRARPYLRAVDDSTLAVATRLRCPRLGFSFDGATRSPGYADPWDYPLLWRARAQGIELRHVSGEDEWPCLIVCVRCTPSSPRSGSWEQIPGSFVFARLP